MKRRFWDEQIIGVIKKYKAGVNHPRSLCKTKVCDSYRKSTKRDQLE